MTSQEKILWIRTDSIGDAVLSAGMLEYIRQHFKDKKLIVVTPESSAQLYEASPFVNELIAYDDARLRSEEGYVMAVLKAIQSTEASMALTPVFSREPLTDFLTLNSEADEKIAFAGDLSNISVGVRDQNNLLYSTLVHVEGEHRHELERNWEFLRGLGIVAPALKPTIWLKDEDQSFADEFFKVNRLEPTSTLVLFPSAKWEIKVYRAYAQAIGPVVRERGFRVLGLGNSAEQGMLAEVLAELGVPSVNVAGKTTLRQSAALLKKSKIAVGNDSALSHVAPAVGTKAVVVLGGGHFGRFHPYSNLTSMVTVPLECFGCNWHCPYSHSHCVKDVPPAVLSAAICQTLDSDDSLPRIFVQKQGSWPEGEGLPRWRGLQAQENRFRVVEV